jgi:hypothetical protein
MPNTTSVAPAHTDRFSLRITRTTPHVAEPAVTVHEPSAATKERIAKRKLQ